MYAYQTSINEMLFNMMHYMILITTEQPIMIHIRCQNSFFSPLQLELYCKEKEQEKVRLFSSGWRSTMLNYRSTSRDIQPQQQQLEDEACCSKYKRER